MPRVKSNISRYSLEGAQFGPDLFSVTAFRGTEEVGRLFRFEIDLVSMDPNVPFEDVVGEPATFTMLREMEPVPVSGVVIHLEQGGRVGGQYVYHAVLAPRLWNFTMNYRSFVYKKMDVYEIVQTVLHEGGLRRSVDFKFALQNDYDNREYCVQYRESDFNFISRLLEQEGIFYFFEQDGQKETIVFTDHVGGCARIEEPSTLPFVERTGMMRDIESVYEVTYGKRSQTGTVLLSEYNYRTPDVALRSEGVADPKMPGTYSEYGDHFADSEQGTRRAKIRSEELTAHSSELRARSEVIGLRGGYLFTMEDHFRNELNQDYLITRVEHVGRQGSAIGSGVVDENGDGDDSSPGYENRFTALPADVPFRPARITPKPEVPGLISAKIESAGEDGKYPYIDDQGRYHVRMHLDIDNELGKGNASCPVRMAQPHSGPNYGMHFPNHENTEAVLAFINGDIDRPMALGTVPNPNNRSPVVAENKMQNILRTKAGNELVMDDTEKETHVLLKSTDAHRVYLDDKEDCIIIETTKKHKVTLDDRNSRIEIRTTDGHVFTLQDVEKDDKGNPKNTDAWIEARTTHGHWIRLHDSKDGEEKGHIEVQTKMGHDLLMDDEKEQIQLKDHREILTLLMDSKEKQINLTNDQGGIKLEAPNGKIELKAMEIETESTSDTKMEAKQNFNLEAAMNVKQKAGMNFDAEATTNFTTKGLMVTSEAKVKNDVKGVTTSVSGTAMTEVKGAMVRIN